MNRQQGIGCFVIAAAGAILGVAFLVSGFACMHGGLDFDCAGLVTVFPLASFALAAVSLAVGMQTLRRRPDAPAQRPDRWLTRLPEPPTDEDPDEEP